MRATETTTPFRDPASPFGSLRPNTGSSHLAARIVNKDPAMNARTLHAARASLYENIAEVLAEPPSRDWFISALCELKTQHPPNELAGAYAALGHAFEAAARQRLLQPAQHVGRKELVEKILAILQLARFAEDCAHADCTLDLTIIEDRQADFLRAHTASRLTELADDLRAQSTPVYAQLGAALRELVQHDARMAAV
jgi:hypothetical protein